MNIFSNYPKEEDFLVERIIECLGSYPIPKEKMRVCVDVGGNVGGFSLVIRDYFDKIEIFEPILNNCEQMKKNLCNRKTILNRVNTSQGSGKEYRFYFAFDPNVQTNYRIHQKAVWDKTGEKISLGCGGFTCENFSHYFQNENCEQAETISLEDVFSTCQTDFIDYLKVDCEGSEFEFLYNKPAVENVGFLVMEVHSAFLGKSRERQLYNFLNKFFNIIPQNVNNWWCINRKRPEYYKKIFGSLL